SKVDPSNDVLVIAGPSDSQADVVGLLTDFDQRNQQLGIGGYFTLSGGRRKRPGRLSAINYGYLREREVAATRRARRLCDCFSDRRETVIQVEKIPWFAPSGLCDCHINTN